MLEIGDKHAGGIIFFLDGKGGGKVVSKIGEYNWYEAAEITNALSKNGFSDWHLPSIDELKLINDNLYKKGLGGFDEYGTYWSSTGFLDEEKLDLM